MSALMTKYNELKKKYPDDDKSYCRQYGDNTISKLYTLSIITEIRIYEFTSHPVRFENIVKASCL